MYILYNKCFITVKTALFNAFRLTLLVFYSDSTNISNIINNCLYYNH